MPLPFTSSSPRSSSSSSPQQPSPVVSPDNDVKKKKKASKKNDDEQKLEEASTFCAKGRHSWSAGKWKVALLQFEQALVILESLLGTFHVLTAKTYYWIGFIYKHHSSTSTSSSGSSSSSSSTASKQKALQAFVKTARIRLLLLGETHESTQEALAAISWVWQHAHGKTPEDIDDGIARLLESLQLEAKGDACLKQKGSSPKSASATAASKKDHKRSSSSSSAGSSPGTAASPHRDYQQAVHYYTLAMETFVDPDHATIMGKRAFAHRGMGDYAESALWYRKALTVFANTVHQSRHPDAASTLHRLAEVLYSSQQQLSPQQRPELHSKHHFQRYTHLLWSRSIRLELDAFRCRDQGYFTKARRKWHQVWALEEPFFDDQVQDEDGKTTAMRRQYKTATSPSSPTHGPKTLPVMLQYIRDQMQQVDLLQSTTNIEESMVAMHTKCQTLESQLKTSTSNSSAAHRRDHSDTDLSIRSSASSTGSGGGGGNSEHSHHRSIFGSASPKRKTNHRSKIPRTPTSSRGDSERSTNRSIHMEADGSSKHSHQSSSTKKDRSDDPERHARTLRLALDMSQKQSHEKETRLQLLEQEKAETQKQMAILEEENKTLVQSVEESAKQLQAINMEKSNSDQQVESLQSTDRNMNVRLKSALEQKRTLETLTKRLQSELKHLRTATQVLEEKTSHLEQQVDLGRKETVATQQAMNEMDVASQKLQDGLTSQLTSELKEMKETLKRRQAELEKERTDKKRLQNAVVLLTKELETMQTQKEALQQQQANHQRTVIPMDEEKSRDVSTKDKDHHDGIRTKRKKKDPKARKENDHEQNNRDSHGRQSSDAVGKRPNMHTDEVNEQRLREVATTMPYSHDSTAWKITIRRPCDGEDDADLFQTNSVCRTSAEYDKHCRLRQPDSIDVIVQIGHDHSQLLITGKGAVYHQNHGEAWEDVKRIDVVADTPLGWANYSDDSGVEGFYSLDAVVEEAKLFRHHYCESLRLSAEKSNLTGSLDSCVVSGSSKQSGFNGTLWFVMYLSSAVVCLVLIIWAFSPLLISKNGFEWIERTILTTT